jgi:hypothetical protein
MIAKTAVVVIGAAPGQVVLGCWADAAPALIPVLPQARVDLCAA